MNAWGVGRVDERGRRDFGGIGGWGRRGVAYGIRWVVRWVIGGMIDGAWFKRKWRSRSWGKSWHEWLNWIIRRRVKARHRNNRWKRWRAAWDITGWAVRVTPWARKTNRVKSTWTFSKPQALRNLKAS